MRGDRSWFHCPMCPDHVWLPTEECVRLPKGIMVRGYITYSLCRKHARRLLEAYQKRRREAQ